MTQFRCVIIGLFQKQKPHAEQIKRLAEASFWSLQTTGSPPILISNAHPTPLNENFQLVISQGSVECFTKVTHCFVQIALSRFVQESFAKATYICAFNPPMHWFLVNCLQNVPTKLGECLVLTVRSVLRSGTSVVDLLQNWSKGHIPTSIWLMTFVRLSIPKSFLASWMIFSMAPSDSVTASILWFVIFWRPISLTSPLAT